MTMDFGIERYRGDSLVLPVALTDSNGSPISLVGATIRFALGGITEASEGYSIARNDAAGSFAITISASLMAALSDPAYYFGCEVTFCLGHQADAIRGQACAEG